MATQNAIGTNYPINIVDGGTGSTTASAARTALGLTIGTNVQAWGSQLDTFSAYNTNGIFVQTAAGTYTGRTITGTSNQISVSNGSGVGGNPTISLPSVVDLSAATNFRVPAGTAPTIAVTGDLGIDTNTDNVNITQGSLEYYDGTRVMYCIAVDTIPSTNNYVLTYNSGSQKYVFSAPGATATTEVTGTTQTAAVNNAYILNNASQVTLTLPTTANLGDKIEVMGKGAGGWKIAQNASQVIHFNTVDTTTGTGGSLASTHQYDCVTLACILANNGWIVKASEGNITIV
jgi:hypothetical protein